MKTNFIFFLLEKVGAIHGFTTKAQQRPIVAPAYSEGVNTPDGIPVPKVSAVCENRTRPAMAKYNNALSDDEEVESDEEDESSDTAVVS